MAAAKKNAEAMAKASGKSVGEVISVTSSNVMVPQPRMMYDLGMKAMTAAQAVPIEAGQLEVSADVTVMYELK